MLLKKKNYSFFYEKTTQEYFNNMFLKIRHLEQSLKIIKKTHRETGQICTKTFLHMVSKITEGSILHQNTLHEGYCCFKTLLHEEKLNHKENFAHKDIIA